MILENENARPTAIGNGRADAAKTRLNSSTSQPQFSGDIATLSHFTNCYAVLVQGKTIRRHLYLNLPAATRAVARAQAKGNRADLVLVKLVPVDGRNLHMEVTE